MWLSAKETRQHLNLSHQSLYQKRIHNTIIHKYQNGKWIFWVDDVSPIDKNHILKLCSEIKERIAELEFIFNNS